MKGYYFDFLTVVNNILGSTGNKGVKTCMDYSYTLVLINCEIEYEL